MCNHCTQDPRDELVYGAKALRGIRDLVTGVHQGNSNLDAVGPGGLAELLDMVETRISDAADKLQDYVPRGHEKAAN